MKPWKKNIRRGKACFRCGNDIWLREDEDSLFCCTHCYNLVTSIEVEGAGMNDTCGRPEDVQERVREQLNQMNQLQPGLSGAGREMGVFEKRLHDELQRTREILDRTRRELAEKESYTRAVVAELEEMKEKQRLVELVRQQRSAIADSRIAVSHLRKIAGARIIEGMIDIVLDNGDRIKIHGQTMTGFGIDGCGGAG